METKSHTSRSFKIFYMIFMIVGLLMLALTVYLSVSNYTKKQSAVKCEGIVLQIFHNESTTIAFEYNEKIYERPYGGYSSSWYSGKEIEVFYDPLKDVIYIPSMGRIAVLICGGFAILFGLIGVICCALDSGKNRKYARLRNNGDCLECTIIDVYINDALYVNSMHPVVITCSYKGSDGVEYRFVSKSVFVDSYDRYKKGDTINVYVNKDNYKEYIVETGV